MFGQTECPIPPAGARDRSILRIEAMLSRAEELEPGYRSRLWSKYLRSLKLTDLSPCDLSELEMVIEEDLNFLLED